MTQPSVASQTHTMRLALADAGMAPDAVDYLNAHGTATPLNDVTETQAIKEVFGMHAHSLAVSSTKSMHGHLVGAAGGTGLVVCTLALRWQSVPPTAHLDVPDPQCDLDYVPHLGRQERIRAAMTNSFAVGGYGCGAGRARAGRLTRGMPLRGRGDPLHDDLEHVVDRPDFIPRAVS